MYASKTQEYFSETVDFEVEEMGLVYNVNFTVFCEIESGEVETPHCPASGPQLEVLRIEIESCCVTSELCEVDLTETPKNIVLRVADLVESWQEDFSIWEHLQEDFSSYRD